MPRAPSRFAGVVRSYVRVSGPDQERIGTSPEAQRAAHLAYCRARDLPDPVFYTEVESAAESSIELRDEQLRLQREMRPGDLVLVTLLDRWSRDVPHAVSTVRAMIKQGVSWIAFQDGIDASTDQGDWMLVQRAAIAEEERRRIYRRTVGRRRELKASGIYCEGAAPLGYQRAPGDRRGRGLALDEAGAAIVRQAFEACIAGASLSEIVAKLPLPPDRRRWTKTAINDLLRHRVYLGEVQAKPGVWIPAKHPAIVTRETFDAAARALAERRIGGGKASATSRTASWILRTRARCGVCGAKIVRPDGGLTKNRPRGLAL